jgi:hypothetical protein
MALAMILALPALTAQATLGAQPAVACSCVSFTDQQAFDRADAVFVGDVVGYEPPPTATGYSSNDPALWIFRVDRVYKGRIPPRQEVVSEFSSVSCGLELPRSGEVLVFATRTGGSFSPVPTPDQYYAGLCSGTRATSAAPVPSTLGDGYRPRARGPKTSLPGGDRVLGPDGEETPRPYDTVTSIWIMLGPVLGIALVSIVVAALLRHRRSTRS